MWKSSKRHGLLEAFINTYFLKPGKVRLHPVSFDQTMLSMKSVEVRGVLMEIYQWYMPKLHYFDYTFSLLSHEFISKLDLFRFPKTRSVAMTVSTFSTASSHVQFPVL